MNIMTQIHDADISNINKVSMMPHKRICDDEEVV